ncbi:MAG: hypothetical protein HY913_04550 [Desulfomonile tiedjei]|nr:hypothetical protein [Desulfomonile tiedjei]
MTINKDIGPQVRAYARSLEQETGCKVLFRRKDLWAGRAGMQAGSGIFACVDITCNPRIATVSYDPTQQDRKTIQPMLAHEVGHGYLWFRDGFYLMNWNASISPRMKELGQGCLDMVMDIAVDTLIKRDGFHPWMPKLIKRMQEAISVRARGGVYVSNSWDVIYEVLHRRLALEYMTIEHDQIPVFDRYLQVCQSNLPSSIIDGVEKRFNLIQEHNIFDPEGNKAAVEALLDVFGIKEHFWFCTVDEDPYQASELRKGIK